MTSKDIALRILGAISGAVFAVIGVLSAFPGLSGGLSLFHSLTFILLGAVFLYYAATGTNAFRALFRQRTRNDPHSNGKSRE